MPRARPKIAILGHGEGDGFLPFFRERAGDRLELVGVAPGELCPDDVDFAVIRDLGDERELQLLKALEQRVELLNPVEAVAISVDKILQSERFRAAGVAAPEFAVVRHPEDVVQVEKLFGPPLN